MILIRDALMSDLPHIGFLINKLSGVAAGKDTAYLSCLPDAEALMGAFLDNRLFVGYTTGDYLCDAELVSFMDVSVAGDEAYVNFIGSVRKGAGAELLHEYEKTAVRSGIRKIYIDRVPVFDFYFSGLGFSVCEHGYVRVLEPAF